MFNQIKSENVVSYCAKVKNNELPSNYIDMNEDDIIKLARKILKNRCRNYEIRISKPADSVSMLQDYFLGADREEFVIVLLDSQHRKIHIETLFYGTINASAVYPREIIKIALKHNASSAIISHNHPSGAVHPSEADNRVTKRIKSALEAIDVKLLDHIICNSGTSCDYYSYAEKSLI